MEVAAHIKQMKEIYQFLINFIKEEEDTSLNFSKLINLIRNQGIKEKKEFFQAYFYHF